MHAAQTGQPYHGPGPGTRPRRRVLRLRPTDLVWVVCLGLCGLLLLLYRWHLQPEPTLTRRSAVEKDAKQAAAEEAPASVAAPYATASFMVSYAYFEKDPIQRGNFEFFLQHGWVEPPGGLQDVTWVFVITGSQCSPCSAAFPLTITTADDIAMGIVRADRVQRPPDEDDAARPRHGSRRDWDGLHDGTSNDPRQGVTLVLRRAENVGMDLASHNASLEYVARHSGGLGRYRYFFLINSSTKGPFYPAYMPTTWHWTHAYMERFLPLPQDDPRWRQPPMLRVLPPGTPYGTAGPPPQGPPVVRAVGSSLVCLPPADAGGPGPRLESWALALDDVAMVHIFSKAVLKVRSCKMCTDQDSGIVVGGEYGLTAALLEAGFNIATLMAKYARDVDWRDKRHWGCNDMVHPSRHGTYDGIAFHPFETVFVKSSWHVADPYTRRYGTWATQHKEADAGTDGEWNERLYRYAISPEAQMPNLLEAAYNVTRVRQLLAKQREAEAEALEQEQRAAGERAMSHDV